MEKLDSNTEYHDIQQGVDCKAQGSSIYSSSDGGVTVECGVSVEFASCFPFCGGFADYDNDDYGSGDGSGSGSGDNGDYDYSSLSGTTSSQTCIGTACTFNFGGVIIRDGEGSGAGAGGGGGDLRTITCQGASRSAFCDGSQCRVSCWDGTEVRECKGRRRKELEI